MSIKATASEARIADLEEALRAALAWWEAGRVVHLEAMSEREATEFDRMRGLLGLPPLRTENARKGAVER